MASICIALSWRCISRDRSHFNQAREKLEKWADDMVLSAEKALADTKEQIKTLRRKARQAVTLEEQHGVQERIQKLERQQRRQRQEIFTVEDEIMGKRDSLIDQLERRLAQRTETETLFTIRWRVV
jgi:predicted  nucleic acid-binding Zn-ribbon protein